MQCVKLLSLCMRQREVLLALARSAGGEFIELEQVGQIWGIGVTRVKQKDNIDPVCGIEGPVLYPGGVFDVNGEQCLKICIKCHNGIKGNCLNRDALANGLWIGDVPQELQELNFVGWSTCMPGVARQVVSHCALSNIYDILVLMTVLV